MNCPITQSDDRYRPRPIGFVKRCAGSPGARVWLVLLTIVCSQRIVRSENAQEVINREYPLKAIYLYNFGRYIKWPQTKPPPTNVFRVGVVGKSPLTPNLKALSGKKKLPGDRTIKVLELTQPADAKTCQIVFVPRTTNPDLVDAVVTACAGRPVLIVGEKLGFARTKGMINFVLQANKLRFEIRPKACQDAQLAPSAKLLKLGIVIRE